MKLNVNTAEERELLHGAMDKLFSSLESKGYSLEQVTNVTLTKRHNPTSGLHVHANCAIKLRFDESVSLNDLAAKRLAKY